MACQSAWRFAHSVLSELLRPDDAIPRLLEHASRPATAPETPLEPALAQLRAARPVPKAQVVAGSEANADKLEQLFSVQVRDAAAQ